MADRQRLDKHGATSAHAHDGRVVMTLWTAGRKPADDPAAYELTPAEAMDLAIDLIKGSRTALNGLVGSR